MPYGTPDNLEYEKYRIFAWRVAKEVVRVVTHAGRICWNVPFDTNLGGKRFVCADWHQAFLDAGAIFNTLIVWNEGNISRRTAWGSWKSPSDPYVTAPCEAILVYSVGERKRPKNGRTPMIERQEFIDWTLGLWSFSGENPKRVKHPAPFPVELPRRLLKMYAYQEDTCFDPFSGSGSTWVACRELGVRFIGVELNGDFCALSRERIACLSQV